MCNVLYRCCHMQVVHWYATLLKLYGYIIPPGTRAGAVG